jgi:FkbM family methyltransferase
MSTIKIGRRDFSEFARRTMDPNNFLAFARMFAVHHRPVRILFEEVFSKGLYPRTVTLKTPTGPLNLMLYSPADMSTLNLIFCRRDYFVPPETKVIVDIGSNIGLSSLFWLTRNDISFVYCYEPSPISFQRLTQNLQAYRNRVSISSHAVSNFTGIVKFGLEPSGVYSSLDLVSENSVECEVIHINKILGDVIQKHGAIDVLKIDSEGHEIRTLEAIEPGYWKHIRSINVDVRDAVSVVPKEFHHSHHSSAERFWR